MHRPSFNATLFYTVFVIGESQQHFWRKSNQQKSSWKMVQQIRFHATNVADKKGRSRPLDFDDQAVGEENKSITTRMLAENFIVDHLTILLRFKKENYKNLGGWIPYVVSDNNKTERTRIFTNSLQWNEETLCLKILVTGIPKGVHCKKPIWCIWWDESGIIY